MTFRPVSALGMIHTFYMPLEGIPDQWIIPNEQLLMVVTTQSEREGCCWGKSRFMCALIIQSFHDFNYFKGPGACGGTPKPCLSQLF